MQIIIPMTGYGSRFVAAGYDDLKPMIRVQGVPAIEWITKGMFDTENDHFVYVCRAEHFENHKLDKAYLHSLARHVSVLTIQEWVKLGPVYDILRVCDAIDDNEPYIVNYCDFYAPWNWQQAKQQLLERGCDGAVIAFTGFQPCLVPKANVYASCLCDENNDLIEIREKYCFCEDKFQGLHSTGTYYFKSGALLKYYFQQAVDQKALTKGEYYSSLPFNFMVADRRKVWVPVLGNHFYTWGTPRDMEEFEFWVNTIKRWARS